MKLQKLTSSAFFHHTRPYKSLVGVEIYYALQWCSFGMSSSLNIGLSTPTPMAFRPLSTYITAPVIADAKGDDKKAAVLPTSSVVTTPKCK